MRINKLILLLVVGCSTVEKPSEIPVKIDPIHEIVKDNGNNNVELIVSQSSCKDFWFNDWDNGKHKTPYGFLLGLAKSFHQANCKNSGGEMADRWSQLISLAGWECSFGCCGLDTSYSRPNKVTSNSAETGHFQSSADILPQIKNGREWFDSWQGECFDFPKCTGKNLVNHGDPQSFGYKFQEKLKSCGALGAEVIIKAWDVRQINYYPFKKGLVQNPQVCIDMFQKIKALSCDK